MKKMGIVLLLIVAAVSAFAGPKLKPVETVCSPCHPVVGDFNGDGLDDFFSALSPTELYFNLGGHFGPPVIATGLKTGYWFDGVGDFNGDGLDDVVVLKPGQPDGPHHIKMNAGSGKFVDAPLPGYVLQVTDFDVDGKADLVLLAFDPSNKKQIGVTLARSNGDGTFAPHQTLRYPDKVESTTTPVFGVGDLNSDGRPDLVQHRGQYLHFYFAGADGQFSAPESRFTFIEPREPHIADVNGDGHMDVTFVSWFGRGDSRVTALFGDGTGRFPSVSHLSLGVRKQVRAEPRSLAIADFYAGGSYEIAVGIVPAQILVLTATGNQLREVTTLDIVSIVDPYVYPGHFRSDTPADLMVFRQEPYRSRFLTELVYAEGAVDPVPQPNAISRSSRTRATGRAVAANKASAFDVSVQSACSANLASEWTIREEGLFAELVTGAGIRSDAAVVDGAINVRLFVEEGSKTRILEGELVRKGNTLSGMFVEDYPPCGGLWVSHKVQAKASSF